MSNLLSFFFPSRLFFLFPLPLSKTWLWIALIALGLMLVGGLVAFFWGRRKHLDIFAQRVSRKLSGLLLTMSVLGWLLLFFRQYRIYFLSTRFLALLWIICCLWWAWLVLRYIRKKVNIGRLEATKQSLYEKYLPKKKKK